MAPHSVTLNTIATLSFNMDVNQRTQTESRRVVTVNGVEFYVEDIAEPLGALKRGSVEAGRYDLAVLKAMADAGLCEQYTKGGIMTSEPATRMWRQVDRRCAELYEQLNEPYSKYRVKPNHHEYFGPFTDEQQAKDKLDELEERNPDVEWRMDEEEIDRIRT
jgi:hypothetical protein